MGYRIAVERSKRFFTEKFTRRGIGPALSNTVFAEFHNDAVKHKAGAEFFAVEISGDDYFCRAIGEIFGFQCKPLRISIRPTIFARSDINRRPGDSRPSGEIFSRKGVPK